MKKSFGVLIALLSAIGGTLAALLLRFRRNQQRADEVWASFRPEPLDLAPVARLTITPLVDARTAPSPEGVAEGLTGEAGVSYLVQADDTRLLFDLGSNAERESPAPLERNAALLGVDLEAVDVVVISHRHYDHVGGLKAQLTHSFVLPADRMEQGEVPVYVPEPLQHPTADLRLVEGPLSITPGVATLGPIPRALFLLGWTPEQALAVNVAGKGMVIIVGCGHQGVQRIIERAEALFEEPLYGVVGGLHLPVTSSAMQRFVGTGRPPWQLLTEDDVAETIDYLRDKGVKRIALSPHDSCDWTVSAFEDAWGPDFQVVTVGQPLEF